MPKLDYGAGQGLGLSYSRLLTAHACPRKFQLENIFNLGIRTEKIDFSYGHAVAAGVQALVVDPNNLNLALVSALAAWDMSLHEEDLKSKKSFWFAVRCIEKFHQIVQNPATNFLRNYEVAMFPTASGQWKPAVELTFAINCHSGYVYEGHIDLVLKEKNSSKYIVLELKTTKFVEVNEASYKNSSQALGYSLVLDSIARDMESEGSYSVLYLICKSTRQEYEVLIFPKSRYQRAQFINELLLDIEVLEMYRELNVYPMRGESCFNFFSPCEFFGKCHMSDAALSAIKEHTPDSFASMPSYDFVYDLEEIRSHQVELLEVKEPS